LSGVGSFFLLLCVDSELNMFACGQDNATTALWNAMVDNPLAVKDFNRLNGHQYLVIQLNTGTALGKELAAGAIWKVCAYLRVHACMRAFLVAHLVTRVPVYVLSTLVDMMLCHTVQACASDDSDKQHYTPAVDGLVRLLRTSNRSAHEQAAGALRSVCVNSLINKLELNRVNGISALVEILRTRS
jgi:hypothetical protein